MPATDTAERSALIHREILQLGVLMLAAAAAFAVTKEVATSNREMNRRDAAEWFRRGQQQIEAGHVDLAIDSFRRATVGDRNQRRYVLALARALARKHEDAAARSALMVLREATPEDPEINLQLARLAAEGHDLTGALRFYHNALYAPWPADQADARRQVRAELIRFLLDHDSANRAVSELIALAADLPDEAARHVSVAQLFAKAGDHLHALDQFRRALRLAPENGEALAGAGDAAFRLGDYAAARTYLRRAPEDAGDVRAVRELVNLVLSNDPLATRIGSAERRRRLTLNFAYAEQRLTACLEPRAGQPPAILEEDTIEDGVDLIDRIERVVAARCPPPTPRDRALILIGRQHGAEGK